MLFSSPGSTRFSVFFFLCCLVFFPKTTWAKQQQEPLEILIVASAHQNTLAAEKYRPVIEKLKKYNPDMVFGEYMSSPDHKAALEAGYWNKANDEKRLAYLRSLSPKQTKTSPKHITKAYAALAKNPNNHQARMQLARDLYFTHDRGNAEYQFFVLETQLLPQFNQQQQASYRQQFGLSDSLKSRSIVRVNSEYHKIFFPLVYELKHPQIYPMDCQKYDNDWNQAWGSAAVLMKEMEQKAAADSTSAASQTQKRINQFMEAGWKDAYANKLSGYAFMNSAGYAKIDAAQNFYGGPTFYGAPGFPTQEVQQMIHFWTLRNQAMCENIIRQAKEKGAKKVVVAVGSSHRSWMEDILKTMPGVKLVNYNEI
ncbi:DUF5694 domain-containing protein [Rufibacter sp. LB8]|uniref:DUF5694 domain-containing protein n=1 Tax=Rufibacter sp. LB8 TaxID=2777781 RepID=UPI00178C5DC2|nr:DUF5694 domain-containing protein [Rufibacter sp. LB8]